MQGRHAQKLIGPDLQYIAGLVISPHRGSVKRKENRLAQGELKLRLAQNYLLSLFQALRDDAKHGGLVPAGFAGLDADVIGAGNAAADAPPARMPKPGIVGRTPGHRQIERWIGQH